MRSEPVSAAPSAAMHPAASRRILRLALGTTLCLLASQLLGGPLSFMAAVLTMFMLALPLPAPGLVQGIRFLVALLLPMFGGLLLLSVLEAARSAGIVLLALALFHSFYYTARGGSPVLGNFMTIGLTVVVTIGSVSPDLLVQMVKGIGMYAGMALVFVWIAHALVPEPARPASPPAAELAGEERDAAADLRSALRAMAVVFPVALVFLFMSASPAYTVVMIKVASMGQQASGDSSRALGRSLLWSTALGGLGAVLTWQLLQAWPSLTLYVLLVALAGLVYGRWIFRGAALHPKAATVTYAFLTMLVILGPAVLDTGSSAGAAFWSRLFLFVLIAVYGTAAVAVFDAFWPDGRRSARHATAGA